jgi:DNA invertase Pin-like site-specific DNA recombinase
MNVPITAIYCRVACKDDDVIACQESMLRQYADNHGYGNIKIYADNGFSGTNLDRPAFKRLHEDIASGIIGVVIVKDIARISRNYLDI